MLNVTQKKQVTYITLNRPTCHNALDDVFIEQITQAFEQARNSRACVLQATGKNFCAGADLDWMRQFQKNNTQESWEDSMKLATLLKTIDTLPIPTLVCVQGCAFGGALGLIAACDIVLCEHTAKFCLSEVKLGLIPAVIAPYLARAIGTYRLRHLAITADTFSAHDALNFGLVHEVLPQDKLTQQIEYWLQQLKNYGPKALASIKALCQNLDVYCRPKQQHACVDLITKIRASDEAQEGINAFFAKRKPHWALESDS